MSRRISRSIGVILKAERMIARRHLAVMRHQTVFAVVAAILGGIGLIMLNVAAFYGLREAMGPAWAALVVALANLALAGIMLVWAGTLSADREVEAITEARNMALADLEDEIEGVSDEVRDLARSIRRIARDPLSAASMGLLGPLLTMLLSHLRKSSGRKTPADSTGDDKF